MRNTKQSKALVPLAGLRAENETADAVKACNDYLRLPNRSLRRLANFYRVAYSQGQDVPTTDLNALTHWSRTHGWVERAEEYDAETERYKTARAHAIMKRGIALTHERMLQLQRMNALLLEQLEQGGLWLKRYKNVKDGDLTRLVEEIRYNTALISDIRDILDDAAKETGGRVHKVDVNLNGLSGLLSSAGNFDAGPVEDATYTDVETDE